jgi:hypothetical protein
MKKIMHMTTSELKAYMQIIKTRLLENPESLYWRNMHRIAEQRLNKIQ